MSNAVRKDRDQKFKKFNKDKLFKNLIVKDADSNDYYDSNKMMYYAVFGSTILFNVASLSTAFFAVVYVCMMLFKIQWVSYVIGFIALGLLEIFKRETSKKMWKTKVFDNRWDKALIAISGGILLFSIVCSTYGTKKGTDTFAPPPTLIDQGAEADRIDKDIAGLMETNKKHRKNRNSAGEIYWPSQKAIERNELLIVELRERKIDLDKKLEGQNHLLTEEYAQEIELTGWALVLLILLFELFFEAGMWYTQYFWWF